MRDERIRKAVNFLNKDEIKNVPFNEKVSYLKNKLTEEELSEVLSKIEDKASKTEAKEEPSRTTQAYSTERRPSASSVETYPPKQSVGSKFITGLNIAAISAASSIGVSYMINNIKDK